MPLPRFSTLTLARFEAPGRNPQNSTGRRPCGKAPSRMNRLFTLGSLPTGALQLARLPYFRQYPAGSQNLTALARDERRSGPTASEKNSFWVQSRNVIDNT